MGGIERMKFLGIEFSSKKEVEPAVPNEEVLKYHKNFEDDSVYMVDEGLRDMLKDARLIKYNSLEWKDPDTPIGGSVEFINRYGDYVRVNGDEEHKLWYEIFGFNLKGRVVMDHHYHEAYETGDGMYVTKSGSVWSLRLKLNEKRIIPYSHTIKKMDNKYITTTGAHREDFAIREIKGHVYQTSLLTKVEITGDFDWGNRGMRFEGERIPRWNEE